MKIKNITDVEGFFQVVDSCEGKVELLTGEGDRLNLKSKLCQYVSLTSILKSDVEIPELEIVAYEPEDTEKIIKFLMKG
ncbi:MAG: polya polymerase [Clostridiales bacterium]|nr:polya polymerase [Roseburia sp.]MDD7635654.1 polya polymerase [Clostridiales bacterium]MDY4113551.1 polya polymerase [Roseburia sp.]